MATPLTADEMHFLAGLGRSPFGHALRGILSKRLQDRDKECRVLDGPALHRAQGAAQYIQQMLDELDEAERKETALRRPIAVPAQGRM
jgi:hypothetical protein